jgi:Amt family ammonium transporter
MNTVGLLLAGCLVMFMQVGFALVETGLCRAKNAAHTVSMNLMIGALGCLGFWAYGFALGWGNCGQGSATGWAKTLGPAAALLNSGAAVAGCGLFGLRGFFLAGLEDAGVLALFFFMLLVMNIAAAIPIGALAERWRWKNFCLYGLWIALPFGLCANWVWGGGWLAQAGANWGLGHGAVDFAGSGVIHALGGVIALAGAIVLGPRIGKFTAEGKPLPIPAHHVPMVVVGTLVLTLGWFGLSAGPALAAEPSRMGVVVVNTLLAGAAGLVAAMLTLQLKGLKPDTTIMCNGLMSGLVAISAACAFVSGWAAVLIGAVAGVVVVLSVFFWERRRIDDPMGAISVHGVSGLWGLLCVGIFANGKFGAGWNGVAKGDGVRGILYGDAAQLAAQVLAAAVLALFGFLMAYAWFKLSNRLTPARAGRDSELAGLDGPEMGVLGYADFTLVSRRN